MDTKSKLRLIKIAAVIGLTASLAATFGLIYSAVNRQLIYTGDFIICLTMMIVSIVAYIITVVFIAKTMLLSAGRIEKIKRDIDSIINGAYDDVKAPTINEGTDFYQIEKRIYILRDRVQNDERQQKQSNDFIRTSISNISHDLKTPLSSIRGYAEGLLDNVADTQEKKEQYTKMIINKVNNITSLLSELSYYSSIDTDGVLDVILPVSVKEYYDDCADEISLDLQAKHIGFEYVNNLSPDVEFCVDSEKISKAVKNMIGNSVKFVDCENGRISLIVGLDGDFIKTTIKDNGDGIPKDKLPYIFDRYYKADTARGGSRSGSGIGLSIVKRIIEDHGGTISASSTEGKGTQISFKLKRYVGEIM